MLYLVKVNFHFKLSITFYYCKNKHDAIYNIDLGTDHLTLTQNNEKQIILAYGKSEFAFL
jgi:hypothetical protein